MKDWAALHINAPVNIIYGLTEPLRALAIPMSIERVRGSLWVLKSEEMDGNDNIIVLEAIPLQPLRVSAGWPMPHHRFYDFEPVGNFKIKLAPDDRGGNGWRIFDENLLHMNHAASKILLNLSWLPAEEPSGHYVIEMVQENDLEKPLFEFESRSKDEFVERINVFARVCHLRQIQMNLRNFGRG